MLTAIVALALTVIRWHRSGAPDLIIVSVRFSPPRPRPGEMVGTIITYRNIGRRQAGNFYIKQTERTGGKTHDGFGSGGGRLQLRPGEQGQYHWGAIMLPESGRFDFHFVVDSENAVAESNEKNNSFHVRLTTSD